MSADRIIMDADVVIIGAGLYGIQAARYYLESHPYGRLTIIEGDSVIGGTWSSKRIYDAFWTQTALGMAEFSDSPMNLPPSEDRYFDFFPAKYVTQYLEAYVDSHTYNGTTIRERVHFSTRVTNVSKCLDGWHLALNSDKVLRTRRLIDATGMTSRPFIPKHVGQNQFLGLQLHHKDFGQYQHKILHDPGINRIAVLGGAKSAADLVYACAKAGKAVSWIIRKDGAGPAAFPAAKGRGMYRNSNDAFYTRFVASLMPSPFNEKTWLYRFLQHTRVGNWLVRKFWDRVDQENRRIANYRRDEGRAMGFENLEPDTPLFWQNDSSGINQRPDFFATIAAKVRIYRRSVHALSEDSVILSSDGMPEEGGNISTTLPVSAIIYCTGWDPTSSIFSAELATELGLSLPGTKSCNDGNQAVEDISPRSHAITTQYPLLAHPPVGFPSRRSPYSPFRLYKAIAPLTDITFPSIVFLGRLVVGNNFRVAEAQALWAVAYLDGHITNPNSRGRDTFNGEAGGVWAKAEEEVGQTIAWCQQRYLNKGLIGCWFFFDAISYSDMLLSQLHLTSHRKKGWTGWWWDLFGPCRANDLKDLTDEYGSLYCRKKNI